MFYEVKKHIPAYFFLALILGVHVTAFFLGWPNTQFQRLVALSLAISYFLWGVMTHVKTQVLNKKIVQEYLFASLLAGGILVLLTL